MGCTEVNPFEVLLNYTNKKKTSNEQQMDLVKLQNK